jgi:hypothetical protein
MTKGILTTTVGGNVSRSEVYMKLLDHVRECQDCAALMAHLHNTEGNDMDKLLARGWLGMSEMFKLTAHQVTLLAQNKLQ